MDDQIHAANRRVTGSHAIRRSNPVCFVYCDMGECEIFCAWAPRAETRGKARLLFDIGSLRACTPHFALSFLLSSPRSFLCKCPSPSCASPRSVRSRARFTGDLLKHEDQCHVANRQNAVRVYLLRSLDPAARVRVVASLGEIRLQSNHDSMNLRIFAA